MLVALIGVFFSMACQQEGPPPCLPVRSCSHTVPTSATLYIQVSNPAPFVSVYSGSNYESGTLVWSGIVAPNGSDWAMTFPMGDYSATARYVVNKDTTVVVDGAELDYYNPETCSGICYLPEDGNINLQLNTVAAK